MSKTVKNVIISKKAQRSNKDIALSNSKNGKWNALNLALNSRNLHCAISSWILLCPFLVHSDISMATVK